MVIDTLTLKIISMSIILIEVLKGDHTLFTISSVFILNSILVFSHLTEGLPNT